MGQFSPSCACCDVCTVVSDTLRDETISPFVEESGDWTATVEGYETGSSDAQVIYPTVYENLAEFETEVQTNDTGDQTAIYRIIWGWEDTDNFWFGEVWSETIVESWGTDRWWYLKVYQRVAGTDNLIEDLDHVRTVGSGTNWLGYPIRVCFSNELLRFVVESNVTGSLTIGFSVPLPSTTFSGRFGFGTGVSIFDTAVFDTWELRIVVSGDPADCVACPSDCCQGNMPKYLTIELAASDPAGCAVSGTYTLALHNAFPSGDIAGECCWYYIDESVVIHLVMGIVYIFTGASIPHDPTNHSGANNVVLFQSGSETCIDTGWDDWVALTVSSSAALCSGITFTTKRFKVAA